MASQTCVSKVFYMIYNRKLAIVILKDSYDQEFQYMPSYIRGRENTLKQETSVLSDLCL